MSDERLVYDIETNGLLEDVTKIHCLVMQNIVTMEVSAYHNTTLQPCSGTLIEGIERLASAQLTAGHNIMAYDKPVLERLKGYSAPNQMHIDTIILSQMLFPERFIHSLEAWMKQLKMPEQKIQNDNWEELSQVVLDRCIGDVKGNTILLKHFQRIIRKHEQEGTSWMKALMNEQGVATIHAAQVLTGVKYDWVKAGEHLKTFDAELKSLRDKIKRLAPPVLKIHGTPQNSIPMWVDDPVGFPGVKQPLKMKKKPNGVKPADWDKTDPKNFEPNQNCIDWFEGSRVGNTTQSVDSTVVGPYCKISFEPINVNSDTQVKEFLYTLGWRPDEWNVKKQDDGSFLKTSPKLSESSFGSLPPGVGHDIKRYNMVKHRRSLIQSIKHPDTKGAMAKVRPDGRLPSNAFTCGTPTARYRHYDLCNIPRPTSDYGGEIRELYGVDDDKWQVGIDLSGIEARMLGHFCYPYPQGPSFAHLITVGDWHTSNANLWGCSRDDAKTELYALMYGAGPLKLGNILGKPPAVGKRNKDAFFKAYTPYADLTTDLEEALKKNDGYIRALDGRRLYVRNKKDVLSSCLQGNAAIVFKLWMNAVNAMIIKEGWPARQMIAYHDELQFEFNGPIEQAKAFGQRVCDIATTVGEELHLNVPITAEAMTGKNWRECH